MLFVFIHLLVLSAGYQLDLSNFKKKIYDYHAIKIVLVNMDIDILKFIKMPIDMKLELHAVKFENYQINIHFLEEQ